MENFSQNKGMEIEKKFHEDTVIKLGMYNFIVGSRIYVTIVRNQATSF